MIVFVLILGYVGFLQTERFTEDGLAGILQRIYAVITLFFFSGIDLGFPPSSAPKVWKIILYICYFIAPALTVSYIYDILKDKLLGKISLKLHDHTVICGVGKNGRVIYELIREHMAPNHKIVIIDQDDQNPYAAEFQQHRCTFWIKADFTKQPVLRKASVESALQIFLTTDKDLDNLKTLLEIYAMQSQPPKILNKVTDKKKSTQERRVYCHITDYHFRDNLKETLLKRNEYKSIYLINSNYSASKRLYYNYFIKTFNMENNQHYIFIFLGFGFFAKMLFYHIQSDPKRSEEDEIYIATLSEKSGYEIEFYNYNWGQQQRNRCKVHEPIYGDIENPAIWQLLEEKINGSYKTLIIFICCDNDISNFDLAVSLKRKGPISLRGATIFCRMFLENTRDLEAILEDELTKNQQKDIILFPSQQELKAAFREELFGVSSY